MGPIKLDDSGSGFGDLLLSGDFDGATLIEARLTVLGVTGASASLDLDIYDATENDKLFFSTDDTGKNGWTGVNATGVNRLQITAFSRFVNFGYSVSGTSPVFTVIIDLVGKG